MSHPSNVSGEMPLQPAPTHSVVLGYIFWIIGFTGSHRFYYGKPITGAIWFFTGGLLLIGWIVDAFLVPSMCESANRRYPPGKTDYGVAWILLFLLGLFGVHRFYMGKVISGVIYLISGGIFGIGVIYDVLTLNTQIADQNAFYREG